MNVSFFGQPTITIDTFLLLIATTFCIPLTIISSKLLYYFYPTALELLELKENISQWLVDKKNNLAKPKTINVHSSYSWKQNTIFLNYCILLTSSVESNWTRYLHPFQRSVWTILVLPALTARWSAVLPSSSCRFNHAGSSRASDTFNMAPIQNGYPAASLAFRFNHAIRQNRYYYFNSKYSVKMFYLSNTSLVKIWSIKLGMHCYNWLVGVWNRPSSVFF